MNHLRTAITVLGILLTSLLAHAADTTCDTLLNNTHVCRTTAGNYTMYSVTHLAADGSSRREITKQEYNRLLAAYAKQVNADYQAAINDPVAKAAQRAASAWEEKAYANCITNHDVKVCDVKGRGFYADRFVDCLNHGSLTNGPGAPFMCDAQWPKN